MVLGNIFLTATAAAQTVTQGYQTDQVLQKGMIVRLKPDDGKKIQALSQNDSSDMLGVVVAAGDAPVSLSAIGADQQAFVAHYGRYEVLVSNQNGPIKAGDMIAISSLEGVGMKAGTEQELVIGKALKTFDGTTNSQGRAELDTSQGKRTISLGRIEVEIAIARNPIHQRDTQPGVPRALSRLAATVTDQPVTAFRIYASVMVLLLSIIVAGSVLYAGVRTGMIAVGRNPLAKSSIVRNLIQVTLMSLIVFLIGLIAVYLLLRV